MVQCCESNNEQSLGLCGRINLDQTRRGRKDWSSVYVALDSEETEYELKWWVVCVAYAHFVDVMWEGGGLDLAVDG